VIGRECESFRNEIMMMEVGVRKGSLWKLCSGDMTSRHHLPARWWHRRAGEKFELVGIFWETQSHWKGDVYGDAEKVSVLYGKRVRPRANYQAFRCEKA
jgi:hypothetical protein